MLGAHTARRPLQLTALGLVLLFLGLLAYGLAVKSPSDTIDTRLSEGRTAPAPGFDLRLLQLGRPAAPLAEKLAPALRYGRLSLSELRGVPVVLNLWASWCAPCREETPRLEHAWKAAGDESLAIVGLDMQDVTHDARGFMREFGVSYPNVRDPSDDVARAWGATGIPETFFVSARGEVVGHVVGAVSSDQLRRGIAAAISGKPLGALEGGARRQTR
jgi:cytochrome c biogenesis protein CcmG/thiol:disulfide interchange protein DsbE